jgi:tetratricopeptide (TPR) repeat protein
VASTISREDCELADGAQQRSRRFSAFISYNYNSHDRKFARRLHRELEGYRLPRHLAPRPVGSGLPINRLKPVFRDADEMTAAPDLSEAVREALAESDFLIVVCSPASAASVWVGREIELFRALHGERHILTALVDGTPQSAFHPALRHGLAGEIEPLAADFRPEGGGKRLAMLKLVGALAGVRLDELIHRDAQRQRRRMATVGASGLAATITVAVLGGLAYTASADAERRRNETTGLVEYMLTDMRKTMQRTGRLDQLAALNDGAMQYYRNQNLNKLSEAQLRQRAKLLQAMGEDDEKRGKLKEARESFEDAHRTTAALLAAEPNDTDRIFAHAQSEYWVGFINWRNGDGAAARRGFEAYAALADRLVRLEPGKAEWQREVGYAENNLGMLAMRQRGDLADAERHFAAALAISKSAAQHQPNDPDVQLALTDGYAWLADAQRLGGQFEVAFQSRVTQREVLERLHEADPSNTVVQAHLLYNQLALARIDAARGRYQAALRRLDEGYAEAARLQSADPANLDVAKQARAFRLFKVQTILRLPKYQQTKPEVLMSELGDCRPARAAWADDETENFCAILKARLRAAQGDQVEVKRQLSTLTLSTGSDSYSNRWGLNFRSEIDDILRNLD